MRLEARAVLRLGVVAAIGFTLMTAFVSYRARQMMKAEALSKADSVAANYAREVGEQLNEAFAVARGMAKSFEAAVAKRESIDRDIYVEMLKRTADISPIYFGTWVQFEPNKFDGRDAEFVNKHYGADGAFLPYITREPGGLKVDTETGTFDEFKDEPYYRLPFDSKQECVIEPYVEPQANNAIMTSVCVPIFEGNTVIGVVGIDMVLTQMSDLVASIRPYETGYTFLVSNSGAFVGHPKADLVGKNIKDFGGGPQVVEAIRSGKSIAETKASLKTGEESYIRFVPIPLGKTKTPWSFALVAPVDKILGGVKGVTLDTLCVGAVSLLILVAVVYLMVRSIVKPLEKIIGAVSEGAEQVDSAAVRVAESSRSMAEGASMQATSLESTTASLVQMSSMTKRNADNAVQADVLMEKSKEAVAQGNAAVSQMSEAIADIKRSTDETANIVKTIDNIAFQTNLLALNAAVEAARAGDAGNGFAVVAQEVRNLAQRSAEAARHTSELIVQAQRSTDNGVAVTSKVNEAFGWIEQTASTVGALIGEIAGASQEQSLGIEQINGAIARIGEITQSNTASSDEAATASSGLSSQARQLMSIASELETLVGGKPKSHAETEEEE
jgi:methyl-accepting chemotaxis protein